MKLEQIASRYRVIRELERGGMGVVYIVEHLHTGERLALKVLHGAAATNPDVIARFKREARAGGQIRSEHVVRVTDADVAPELDGAPFFVMELLEGFDLEKAVGKLGPLRPDVVVDILLQVGRALDKAHAIGIVHRDLKPENIFLHWREHGGPIAKILDFGISKFQSPRETSGIGVTADGALMGTPAYMAPEQAKGMVESMGPATDVWAMGLIALRLVTGEIYWTARTPAELMVQILVTPMPRPSDRWPWLGQGIDAWFARSCDRDPSKRWGSVSEQIAALDGALRTTGSGESGQVWSGASMEAIVEALRRISADNANRFSLDADPSTGANLATGAPLLPQTWPVDARPDSQMVELRATTGGPGSITLRPSGRRRPRRSRTLLAVIGVASLAVGFFGYRSYRMQQSAAAGAGGGPEPVTTSSRAAIGTPTGVPERNTLVQPADRTTDAGSEKRADSVDARQAASPPQEPSAAVPAHSVTPPGRRPPRMPTPRNTRPADPMAP